MKHDYLIQVKAPEFQSKIHIHII